MTVIHLHQPTSLGALSFKPTRYTACAWNDQKELVATFTGTVVECVRWTYEQHAARRDVSVNIVPEGTEV